MAGEITDEELCNMKLHQRISIDPATSVLRVVGGWIYTFGFDTPTMVFVPMNGDFTRRNGAFVERRKIEAGEKEGDSDA